MICNYWSGKELDNWYNFVRKKFDDIEFSGDKKTEDAVFDELFEFVKDSSAQNCEKDFEEVVSVVTMRASWINHLKSYAISKFINED